MSFALRPGETVRAQARIHWISSFREVLIALFALFLAVLCVRNNSPEKPGDQWMYAALIVGLGLLPFLRVWLKNKFRTFTVTDQRIVIVEGMISRFTTEIPLNKVNDITMRQGLIQRLVDAGDIAVFTGNDISTLFQNVAHPVELREAISRSR